MNILFNTDSGDSIYLLAFIKAMGGGGYIFCRSSGSSQTHHSMKRELFERLFSCQSYVNAFGFCNQDLERHSFTDPYFWHDTLVDFNVEEMYFKKGDLNKVSFSGDHPLVGFLRVDNISKNQVDLIPNLYWDGEDAESYVYSLIELALMRFNLDLKFANEKWLELPPRDSRARVHDKKYTISRSTRHTTSPQIMEKIVQTLGPENFCFLGLPHEHSDFCQKVCKIDTVETKDFFDVAVAIDDSEMFIGNQSSCCAIAEGLKKPVIQETSLEVPNCTFSRIRKDFFLGWLVDGEVRLTNDLNEEQEIDFHGLSLKKTMEEEHKWANRQGRCYDKALVHCVHARHYYTF